ncbi:penicillin acylase family protein [Pendulispora albinea]|uniref:Penicillin acylase family protein n=1 Tax=Pendulispora albinea TaxID=2741071 RepID=A0ABZ2MBE0_9BACT
MNASTLRSLWIPIAFGLAACASVTDTPTQTSAQPLSEPRLYFVPDLNRPVELVEDRWGVPHIYANSTEDVFLAQGFNAARERLFQIDLWHRRGLGLLSEAFGAAYVEQDTAARLFLYRGDMDREWASYGPDARMAATRFAAGVNAYIDWLARNPDSLPEEFRRLGYAPGHWRPEDVVRIRSHGLSANLSSEVARARMACVAGVEADQVRVRLRPEWHTRVPAGFDPCALPSDVLRTYQLATQAVVFTRGALHTVPAVDEAGDVPGIDETEGSNNWTIAPAKTTTGRPILANDPHRLHPAPSLRYIVHLSAPGLDVVGAGEPAQPGISMGHNGTIAFGLTVFHIDQEDLYAYELDPNDHGRYRYGDGWEALRTVREQVPVAGQPARDIALWFTRHGPVIKIDEARHRAYAVRSAWQEPGTAPYYGSLRFLRARSFAEFKGAMRNWGTPSENQVYADTRGNIGWVPGGLAPKRRGYDGLLPVPGDGRYEWEGFYSGDDLPSAYNPPAGFIATANQMNLPPDFPHAQKPIGFEWANPSRYQRITDVLASTPRSSVADSVRLQSDRLSLPARQLVALIPAAQGEVPEEVRTMLRSWDGIEEVDSAPAALFEVWRRRYLGPGFVKAVLSPAAASLISQPDSALLVDALEHPQAWFGEDAVAKRDRLLSSTLDAAYADTARLLGPRPNEWRWGNLLRTVFEHPLGPVVDEATRARLNVGPLPRGGSELTVNASSFRSDDFRHTAGPSFRMVLDVGNWDGSRAVNTPGQSGKPGSRHYRDLAEAWSTGGTFPLAYSRPFVERNAERRIFLVPAH